jgi:hypothetical protein
MRTISEAAIDYIRGVAAPCPPIDSPWAEVKPEFESLTKIFERAGQTILFVKMN